MNESSSEDDFENEIKLEGGITFTRLTELVRNQYVKYLKRQLEENLRTCWGEAEECSNDAKLNFEAIVKQCAQNLEDQAIKEATVTQLYQRAMVKTIDSVRRCTEECRLSEEMQAIVDLREPEILNCNVATKATQTEAGEVEPAQTLTLDERINLFQKQMQRTPIDVQMTEVSTIQKLNYHEPRKRVRDVSRREYTTKRSSHRRLPYKESKALKTTPPLLHSPTPPPQTNLKQTPTRPINDIFEEQLAGDEVAEELEKLFMEQEEDLEEIFGISLVRKNSDCCAEKSQIPTKENIEPSQKILTESADEHISVPHSTPNLTLNESNQLYRQPVSDLRHSPWPCECFMQRRRLSAKLTRMVEEDIRWFDILKMQFSLLFGDFGDEHIDFAPCSPSLDMDEIIIGSCMRRISPWIVRHLMKPLQDGLIGNRFLFKKLAKKLAYHIILENQYPSELVIKNAVENFFCLHRAVMTVDDLDDIEGMRMITME